MGRGKRALGVGGEDPAAKRPRNQGNDLQQPSDARKQDSDQPSTSAAPVTAGKGAAIEGQSQNPNGQGEAAAAASPPKWHFQSDCITSNYTAPVHYSQQRCSKCLCRVCQVPARECEHWAHGAEHHCLDNGLSWLGDTDGHEQRFDQRGYFMRPRSFVQLPPVLKLPKPEPEEVTSGRMQHVLDIRFKVEAAGPDTLAALGARLAPWGCQRPMAGGPWSRWHQGRSLCLRGSYR